MPERRRAVLMAAMGSATLEEAAGELGCTWQAVQKHVRLAVAEIRRDCEIVPAGGHDR